MATTSDTLTAWGIQHPADVIEAAQTTGLPLALACSLLDQESAGGHNVWGHDPVETGGVYAPGSEVTAAAYRAYKPRADRGEIGRQGVGPCQLTGRAWQDAADNRGGCWDPKANMLAAFTGLVALTNQYGLPDGVRRYNGSGPAAEQYRDRMMTRYRAWTDRLGTANAEDDMTPDEHAALLEIRDALRASGLGKGRLPGRSKGFASSSDDAFGWILTAAGVADTTLAELRALTAQVQHPQLDYAELAAELIHQLGQK